MFSARRILARLRAVLAEMAYANNRRVEMQTGWVLTPETARRHSRAEATRLELAFARESAVDPEINPVREHACKPTSVDPAGLAGTSETRLEP